MTETKLVPMPRNKDVQRFFVYIKPEVLKDRGYDGSNNRVRVQCERKHSDAFNYGNQTCVVMEIWEVDGYYQKHIYDTRYEGGCDTPDLFEKWAGELVADYYGENAERIEQF